MSILSSVKDVMVGQAMRLAGDPRVTRLMTDPRLMNAAMKAMSMGGNIKGKLDQCGKVAGGMFGLATQEEVTTLRGTIQNLEDQVSVLETRAAAALAESDPTPAPSHSRPAPSGDGGKAARKPAAKSRKGKA